MITEINPFYIRASEYTEYDDKFLDLFSPEILNIFAQKEFDLWGKVNIIRSSPGGGKTSLLKLFTPRTLNRLKESLHEDNKKEIYNRLRELSVYDDSKKIMIIGSLISFNNEYHSVEFLTLSEWERIKIFNALLNIRIILSFFQSFYVIKNLNSENDYERLTFNNKFDPLLPSELKSFKNGLEVFNWACDQEEIICNKIESIENNNIKYSSSLNNLYSLDLISPNNIFFDGNRIEERILIMFDDVNNLSSFQRKYFVSTIIKKRPLINVWIAERLKALTMDEWFSEGETENRDMNTIYLEKYWSKNYSSFEKFAKSVANRRLNIVAEPTREFSSFLLEEFEAEDIEKIERALNVVKDRILNTYGNTSRYKEWIDYKNNLEDDLYQQLVSWRSLEILLFRDRNKSQQRLKFIDEESILTEEELNQQDKSDVKGAAELFLNKEFKIPYYFGIKKLCRLSSFNIEQFLSLSGKLFEEIRSNVIKKVVNSNYKVEIFPKRQEQILKKVISKVKWNELMVKVPNFPRIKIFLDSIGEFCRDETYTPNAWNSPGLNGVAISMHDRQNLKKIIIEEKKNTYYDLAKCISDCIAYNLLDYELNYRVKNNDWMLLYLNKMFCVKYELPLNQGKFKEQSISELSRWYYSGYISRKNKELIS